MLNVETTGCRVDPKGSMLRNPTCQNCVSDSVELKTTSFRRWFSISTYSKKQLKFSWEAVGYEDNASMPWQGRLAR